jgi:hypothetical protein
MPDASAHLDTLSDIGSLNNRVKLRLLNGLGERQLKAAIRSRGRTVVSLFAHIHFIRTAWLERRVPSAARGLKKIDRDPIARATIAQALKASAKAMGELFAEAEKTGQMKGTKTGPLTYLCGLPCARGTPSRANPCPP